MKLADLPKDVRDQIVAGQARVAGTAGVKIRAASVVPKPRAAAFRCFGCKQTFTSWAASERHGRARECGTGRIETLYEQEMM